MLARDDAGCAKRKKRVASRGRNLRGRVCGFFVLRDATHRASAYSSESVFSCSSLPFLPLRDIWQATRAYLHAEADVVSALEKRGFKVCACVCACERTIAIGTKREFWPVLVSSSQSGLEHWGDLLSGFYPPWGAGAAQRPDRHQLLLLQDPRGSQGVDVICRRALRFLQPTPTP